MPALSFIPTFPERIARRFALQSDWSPLPNSVCIQEKLKYPAFNVALKAVEHKEIGLGCYRTTRLVENEMTESYCTVMILDSAFRSAEVRQTSEKDAAAGDESQVQKHQDDRHSAGRQQGPTACCCPAPVRDIAHVNPGNQDRDEPSHDRHGLDNEVGVCGSWMRVTYSNIPVIFEHTRAASSVSVASSSPG